MDRLSAFFSRAIAFVKRHPVGIALAGVFVLYLATRLPAIKSLPIFCDEGIYLRWSREALRNGRLLVSLTDGKQPLHPLAMVPFLALFKDPLVAGRLFSVMCGAFNIWGIYLLGKELLDARLGVAAGFLYAVCPYALFYDRLALTESLLLPLFIFAVYFAVKAARTRRYLFLIPTALTTGLALLTKGTGPLLFFVIPFALLLDPKLKKGSAWKRPLLTWVIGIVLSFAAAYGMYSLLRLSSDYHYIPEMARLHSLSVSQLLHNPFKVFWSNLWGVLRAFFIYLTPVFLITCLAGVVLGLARKWRGAYFLASWLVLVGLVECFTATYHFTRFWLVLVPPLLFGGGYALLVLYDMSLGRTPASARPLLGNAGEPQPVQGETGRGLAPRSGEESGGNLVPRGRRDRLLMVATAVLLAAMVVPAAVQMTLIVAAPARAWLPYEDREQFVTQWPAGWGTDRVVEFLEREATDREILVGAVGAPGTQTAAVPADTLSDYLFDNENVEIIPIAYNEGDPFPAVFSGQSRPVFVVLNAFEDLPDGWPLEEIARYPKDGNERLSMYVTRVARGGSPRSPQAP